MMLAGFKPCGVLCEPTNPDGTMARGPEIRRFADKHRMPVLTVDNLAASAKGCCSRPAERAAGKAMAAQGALRVAGRVRALSPGV